MLNVSQLSCERDHRLLFENLSFVVGEGEVLLVEGGNGAGKTTLLRILCGLYTEFNGLVSRQPQSAKPQALRDSGPTARFMAL